MKLLVIIICLLCERYLIHYISYQRFSWFNDYSQKLLVLASGTPVLNKPWLKLFVVVLPVTIIATIVFLILNKILFGFIGFILSIFVLYYCIGPQNIFYPLLQDGSDLTEREQVTKYFSQVNSQLFALLFWYLVGGPVFALTYRIITLCQNVEEIKGCATDLSNYLEWIPARIVMMLFLIVGNFQKGLSYFSSAFFYAPSLNNQAIAECGLLALQSSEGEEINAPLAERFIEYALIVLLVIIALFTMAAWI